MTKRSIYLETIPPAEAVARARAALQREELVREERVPAQDACGRVLAHAVHARRSSPCAHSAAMDGYAVRAADTFAAREGRPLLLAPGRTCFAVNTGNPLPEGCDAVIMIEHTSLEDGNVRIEAPAYPWQHVRRIGEDIVATELLFPRNRLLRPWDVAALLSGGIWDVPVWEQIRVGIIPTGDEVVDFAERPEPRPGQVVESNSQMLAALCREAGCTASRVPPVPDDPEALGRTLRASLDAGRHITIMCAGSSAGSRDYTRSVLEREGRVLAHGIAAMPGKPSILAVCRGRLVVGAPGYPVSALVCFSELVAPLAAWLARRPVETPLSLPAELTRAVPSRLGMEEHIRLAAGRVGERVVAMPLNQGAGNITSVTRAQAVLRIPARSEGLPDHATADVELMVPEADLDRTIVCIGSHDNLLDLMADELMGLPEPFRLASAHAGSMGGLTALRNGSCHMSGMHLFDPESGDFNTPFLLAFLPGDPLRDYTLINLAIRRQGLMTLPGNPLGIRSVADLTRARFINRQRGAGTRVLLDWKLKEAGINPADVRGYEKEEFTHMAVAANVLSGAADCGMGIYAAARALGLDFAPVALERYDLAVPTRFLNDPRILAVRSLLDDPAFKQRIEEQGGYDASLTGRVMRPGMGLGPAQPADGGKRQG